MAESLKYRGSRKHILDWVEQEEFPAQLTHLLKPLDAVVEPKDIWRPLGYSAPEEARLNRFGPYALQGAIDWQLLNDWWLVHKQGANTPNWDLATTCSLNLQKGLVLIEAKAHVSELKEEGKPLSQSASERSRENHQHIAFAIDEANEALNQAISGVNLSRDQHYQLSNRVAFSWKLASMGLPVVLIYLGFIGDSGIADVGEPFKDHSHWENVLHSHIRDILPNGFVGRWIDCGPAPFQMIVRSRLIQEPSLSRD